MIVVHNGRTTSRLIGRTIRLYELGRSDQRRHTRNWHCWECSRAYRQGWRDERERSMRLPQMELPL